MKSCVTTLVLLCPALVFAAPAAPDCNQLGREVALRAAEQLAVALDAEGRRELAGLAESVCIEFSEGGIGETAAAAPAAAVEATAAPEPGQDSPGLLDLQVIPPEERVQRPGLKRR